MDSYSHLFVKDVLNNILLFLEKRNLIKFMLCNKFLLNFIGKSVYWFDAELPLLSPENFLTYEECCQLIQDNTLIPNTVKVQLYYGEHYYEYRMKKFLKYEFRNMISIQSLMITNENQLRKFLKIIMLKKIIKGFGAKTNLDQFNIIIKQISCLQIYAMHSNPEILKKILLPIYDTGPINTIFLDLENDKNEDWLNDKISYSLHNTLHNRFGLQKQYCRCSQRENFLILPKELTPIPHSKIKEKNMINRMYFDEIYYNDTYNFKIRNYFTLLGDRMGFKSNELYQTVSLVLRILCLYFK
jgi:hypothetical protein